MTRKKKYHVILFDQEYKKLKSVVRKNQTSKTVRCRCQVLFDMDEAHGKLYTHKQCAKSNGVCIATVSNTVRQYIEYGIDSVIKLKKNTNSDNAKRKLDGRVEAKLIEIACGPAPERHSRWTLRLLEEKAKVELEVPVSKDTIGRALKKTNFDLTAAATGASHQKKMQNS